MKRHIIYIGIVISILSCTKESAEAHPTPTSSIEFSLNHISNSTILKFDTIQYSLPSGFEISTTRLEYYLSNLKLIDTIGNNIYTDNEAHYINARNENKFTVHEVPLGPYHKIEMTIGLVPHLNVHGRIANTPENIGMIWPINMGGGYHFLKFEGHFKRSNDATSSGFAIHLGETGYEVIVNKQISFELIENNEINLSIEVDVLNWLSNPYTYDFDFDGNYTMGIPALMEKIQDNGNNVITKIIEP